MSLPNPSMDFTPFDPLTAAEMDDIVENVEALATGTGLDGDAVADSKLVYGKVRSRRGGSATDWTSPGTNNYSYDAVNTFIQCGAVTSGADGADVAVTFPNAYSQKPLVIASITDIVNSNAYVCVDVVTTTGFNVRNLTGGAAGGNVIGWIAIGQ